ncbi:hypothetical protein BD309DRAFT_433058 [Dichomitus squalens]|nr:hypothetical protein BD309DRAFT_433058 [Dichomitus squalens]
MCFLFLCMSARMQDIPRVLPLPRHEAIFKAILVFCHEGRCLLHQHCVGTVRLSYGTWRCIRKARTIAICTCLLGSTGARMHVCMCKVLR